MQLFLCAKCCVLFIYDILDLELGDICVAVDGRQLVVMCLERGDICVAVQDPQLVVVCLELGDICVAVDGPQLVVMCSVCIEWSGCAAG